MLERFQCYTAFQENPGERFGPLTERFRQLREFSPVLKIDRGPSKLMVQSGRPKIFLKALAAACGASGESFAAVQVPPGYLRSR